MVVRVTFLPLSLISDANAYYEGNIGQQSMESGFMKGLVTSPAPFQFSCSSGNCTWPDFSALGICVSCSDVTEATKTSHEVINSFNRSNDATALHGDQDDCVDILCKTPAGVEVRMSRGCSFKTVEDKRGSISSISSTDGPVNTVAPMNQRSPSSTAFTVRWYPHGATTYQTLPTSIASNATCSNFSNEVSDSTIAVLAISKINITGHGLSGRIAGPANITECQLNWCEKVFQNVHVVRGHRKDVTFFDDTDLAKTSGVLGSMNITNRNLSESELKHKIGYWKSWVEGGRLNTSDIPEAWRFVADQLTFTVAADSHFKFGPVSVISEAANPPKVFENIAEAMTRQLYIGNNSSQQPGHAYVEEVFIVVRWQWAVFPMVLVLLGLVFLAGNLWVNSREGVFLWKSSLLPLLFHGLDGFDPEILDANESSEMTEAAKKMYARLEQNETGSTKLVSK